MPVGSAAQLIADLRIIREVIGAHVTLSFLDTPLALLVLIILFLMHPTLGWFSVIGALAQFLIGFFNKRRIREPMMMASCSSNAS
ncbi:MAG: hypothetical protein ACP5R6_00585 [Chlorobaculum sp.]